VVARRVTSNSSCERREGAQVGNLVRVGGLVTRQTVPCTGETPRIGCGGLIAIKVVGGGDMKVSPRCEE